MAPHTAAAAKTHAKRARARVEPYMPSYLVKGQKCVVCGDLATGLHYRAFTCEGCKGFFRRVYQRGADQFECKGQPRGHCPISKSTRNACQRCRQDKCLGEGMDPQLVLGEVQRRAKRRLIEGNRERRQLERRQQRIRRALMAPLGGAEAEELKLRPLGRQCARTFWALFEAALDGKEAIMESNCQQMGPLHWRLRVLKFAQAVVAPKELDPAQSRQLCWRSVLLLLAVLRTRMTVSHPPGDGFGPPPPSFSQVQDEFGGAFGTDLLWMARGLAPLELTDRQLALMAAHLVFLPVTNASALRTDLLAALRLETADNLALGDTVEERLVANWPVLALRLVQMEALAQKHQNALEALAEEQVSKVRRQMLLAEFVQFDCT